MRFILNGKRVNLEAHPLKRLLDVLREDCRLTGTKEGCGEGECGACTVLIDGQAVNSCLIPFAHVRSCKVLTIEGLRGRHPLQEAFVVEGGAQCGICTPGMIMAAVGLEATATLDQIRDALAGNLCRCTGYTAIYRAIENGLRSSVASRRSRADRKGYRSSVASRPAFADLNLRDRRSAQALQTTPTGIKWSSHISSKSKHGRKRGN